MSIVDNVTYSNQPISPGSECQSTHVVDLVNRDQIRQHLELLFAQLTVGWILIWVKQTKTSYFFKVTDLDGAADCAAELARTFDVYVGCALRECNLGPSKRGTKDTCILIPGFWADVDIAADVHSSTNLPRDIDEAFWVLEDFHAAPSILLHSGYGLQAWWLFDRGWGITESNRDIVELWSNNHQRALNEKAFAYGWKLDNTADLPRILRLAGTVNHKAEPKPVRFINYKEKKS